MKPNVRSAVSLAPTLLFGGPRLLQPQYFYQVAFGAHVVRVEFDNFADLGDGVVELPFLIACAPERNANCGAEGGIRTPTGRPTRPSSVRVYQFHHFGT